jgi:hypothetical protein
MQTLAQAVLALLDSNRFAIAPHGPGGRLPDVREARLVEEFTIFDIAQRAKSPTV